jgi:hypothetical protein
MRITRKERDTANAVLQAFLEGYELDPVELGHKAALLAGAARVIARLGDLADAEGCREELLKILVAAQ